MCALLLTEWMNPPQLAVNCPPGLEYLTQINQLLVHQKVELLEGILFNVDFQFLTPIFSVHRNRNEE
jgi:hypothetical protein